MDLRDGHCAHCGKIIDPTAARFAPENKNLLYIAIASEQLRPLFCRPEHVKEAANQYIQHDFDKEYEKAERFHRLLFKQEMDATDTWYKHCLSLLKYYEQRGEYEERAQELRKIQAELAERRRAAQDKLQDNLETEREDIEEECERHFQTGIKRFFQDYVEAKPQEIIARRQREGLERRSLESKKEAERLQRQREYEERDAQRKREKEEEQLKKWQEQEAAQRAEDEKWAPKPFDLLNEARFSSQWIVAQQGSGKTELLKHMLSIDIPEDCSLVVLDSKGDLTGAVRQLALGDRLIVFDPDQPFAINPFDVEKSDEVVSHLGYMLSGLLDTTVTQKQRTFFDSLIPAILEFPNPTIPLLFDVLTKGPEVHAATIRQLSSTAQDFFQYEWGTYKDTASEMQWRLKGLLTKQFMRTMFSAPKTRFHIADAINTGKIVVIDNSQQKCGGPENCSFIGRLFVSEIWAAGTARQGLPEHLKKPTFVYIDEAHLVIKRDAKIAAIIDELRSQRIGLILAHQRLRQIEDSNVRSALDNCAIKMVNVPPGEDLDYFSKLLDIPRERMTKLKQGHFATDIRFQGASIMQVPKAHLPYRIMTESEEAALKRRMAEQYGVIETETRPTPPPPPPPPAKPPPRPAPKAKKPDNPPKQSDDEGHNWGE